MAVFEQALVTDLHNGHRAWTTMAGMAAQATLVAAAVMAPLVAPATLPSYRAVLCVFRAPGPPPPPPARGVEQPQRSQAVRPFQMRENVLLAPRNTPDVAQIIDDPVDFPAPAGSQYGVQGGTPGGVPNGIIGGFLELLGRTAVTPPPAAPAAAAPKPAAAAAPAAEPSRIKQGGNVQDALVLRRVLPQYPVLARQARVSGAVELLGIIGTDGRVKELRVLHGHPLLVKAALDAVRQWLYRPTHLNGEPVEVVAPIFVHFKLE